MEGKVSFCGFDCTECPAYIATMEGDHGKLEEMARAHSTEERTLTAEDAMCDGCLGETPNEGALYCTVRECALEKEVENCAHCSGYSCDKLDSLLEGFGPEYGSRARDNLEGIRSSLK